MPFVPKKHTYNAHINEVVLGVGDKAVTIGLSLIHISEPTRPY